MALVAPAVDAERAVAADAPHARGGAATFVLVVAALATAAAALVYFLLHRQLMIDWNAAVAQTIPGSASLHPGRDVIAASGPFLAVTVGAAGLVALRHRVAAFAIFVLLALTPLTQSTLGALPADRITRYPVAPIPLGGGWIGWMSIPTATHLWGAATVDFALAFLPAAAIAFATYHRDGRGLTIAARFPRLSRPEMVGAVGSLFAFWLVLHTHELMATSAPQFATDAIAFLPFFLLGLVLSGGRRRRFVVLLAVPVLWSTTTLPPVLAYGVHALDFGDLGGSMTFLAAVAAGTLWRPLARFVADTRDSNVALLILLNVLNLADLILTRIAVGSGQAAEANPVAGWLGPGLKVLVVGVASIVLARMRPRVLVWLVLAMLAVLAWHASGIVLNNNT